MSFTAHAPHIALRLKMPSLVLSRRAHVSAPAAPAGGLQVVAKNTATAGV